jgi:T3SS (YopN, CesT) and YbjN peptide-binding chaperone 1
MNAVAASCAHIEKALGKSPAFRKVEDRLYVVKQGSSYVMISVIPTGGASHHNDRAVVRVLAQVVSGVRPEPSLFRQLLILNGQLRFGAFAYVPDGHLILFNHMILGGDHMDDRELVATVHDVALIADEYDDRIVARYGGARMQDVVEESAMARLFGGEIGEPFDENNP